MFRLARHGIALAAAAIAVVAGSAASAEAGSWVFRPSYYSHELPVAAPRNFGPLPQVGAHRAGPYVTRPAGAYARFSWRRVYNRNWIGGGYDNLNYIESYIQFGEQF
jgi:hypothetical protein